MTNLDKTEFVGSLMGILPSGGFRTDSKQHLGTVDLHRRRRQPDASSSRFFVYKLSDKWRLGASLTSYLGISANLRRYLGRTLLSAIR